MAFSAQLPQKMQATHNAMPIVRTLEEPACDVTED
jgi:hypothetical protein